MNITLKIQSAVIVVLAALTNCALADSSVSLPDSYLADSKTKTLIVNWKGGSKTIENVVGSEGESTRELVDFNGVKALHYENLATRSSFEAYLTLKRIDGEITVDCVYTNVRNEQNGILINKAVCGLNRPLAEEYEDSVYEFSDEWKSATGNVVVAPLFKTPAKPVEVNESSVGGVKFFRVYKSQEDLSTSLPEAVLKNGEGRYTFGTKLVFSVYEAGDLSSPVFLDVSSGSLGKPFVRYDPAALKKLF